MSKVKIVKKFGIIHYLVIFRGVVVGTFMDEQYATYRLNQYKAKFNQEVKIHATLLSN